MKTLMERANELDAEGIFLGGKLELFEVAGRKLLISLLSEGLFPSSKVLDIGCGCLRGGYWLIHFLEKGCYFGIEPNVDMLNAGITRILEPGLADIKHPRFDHNDCFDFTIFGERFDFYVARSIWTHASKQQIQFMLDGFVDTANNKAILLTSYVKPSLFKRDYEGTVWSGRSHESDTPEIVRHSFDWIQDESRKRGLIAKEIREKSYNYGNQRWIRIKHEIT